MEKRSTRWRNYILFLLGSGPQKRREKTCFTGNNLFQILLKHFDTSKKLKIQLLLLELGKVMHRTIIFTLNINIKTTKNCLPVQRILVVLCNLAMQE